MKKVTAIGEILFDVYPEGKKLGGAPFNFIYHIKKLIGTGNFVSRIGKDEYGNEIKKFFNEKNISAEFLQVDDRRKTGVAKPMLDDEKVPDWKIEENTAYDFIERTDKLENLINEETDCLYFGTLAQRNEVSRETIQSFFNKEMNYFCDLNIRQKFYTKEIIEDTLTTTTILKLNEDELKLINNLLFSKEFDEEIIVDEIIKKYHIKLLCVTKGSSGSTLYTNKRKNHFEVEVEEVVDTVGTGDAYAAVLCIGFLKNWEIEKTNRLASEFAAEIIKVNGALPVDEKMYNNFRERITDE